VGDLEGDRVGAPVVGEPVGDFVGAAEGEDVGAPVGALEGDRVGSGVVGDLVGAKVVGTGVGDGVGIRSFRLQLETAHRALTLVLDV